MSKYMIKVPYLEGDDINSDGSLKEYVGRGKPTVVMVQGNFCGYCTQAKPDFQKFAKSANCMVATVQSDGDEKDQLAGKKLSVVNKARGVPAYLGFDKNGKFVGNHEGGRDTNSLIEFANRL